MADPTIDEGADTEDVGVIAPDKLQETIESYRNMKARMDTERTNIKNLLTDAEENGLNKAAFKLAVRLLGDSPHKRADFLASFDAYREMLSLDAQGELPFEEDDRPGDNDPIH